MPPLPSHNDDRIVQSWHTNASAWTTAVREQQIESRRLVTNRAIVDAVRSRAPKSVLDVGCGEGWLARELASSGIRCTGIDVVPDLIERARALGGGDFHVVPYESLAAGEFAATVDAVVINFALLGAESVDRLLRALPTSLAADGSLIIQTLHPVVACGDLPYADGWREGSWAGFSADFTDPAPWYFRTLETWATLIAESGFQLLEMREPLHPSTGRPTSVIFIAKVSGP